MRGWAEPHLCPPRGWAGVGSELFGISGEFWLLSGGDSIWHCSSRDLFLSSFWRWELQAFLGAAGAAWLAFPTEGELPIA